MTKIAINQSNYLPWKGYFRIIKSVDVFVFLDDVQYTKNDWRNRNQLLTKGQLKWITIPVGSDIKRLVNQVDLPKGDWRLSHMEKIRQSYQNTANFAIVYDFLAEIILDSKIKSLSDLNQTLITRISSEWLNVKTRFESSELLKLSSRKSQRVLDICMYYNASSYVSGPAAKKYLKVEDFEDQGINVEWVDYSFFAKYNQDSNIFVDNVSIIDLLFQEGQDAKYFI